MKQGISLRGQGIAALLVGVIIITAILWARRRFAPPGPSGHSRDSMAQFLARAEAGDDQALAELVQSFSAPPSPAERNLLITMLVSNRPEIRAAAANWIGLHRVEDLAARLVERLNDNDWRVRAAAFDAFTHLGEHVLSPTHPLPMRDTPVDDRERLIFTWMTQWRAAGNAVQKLPLLCELYPDYEYWLTGTRLAEACLACHAPHSSMSYESAGKCAQCHFTEVQAWQRSGHALSTMHVGLARVDPVTQKVVYYDTGNRRGLTCISCHRQDLARPNPPLSSSSPALPPDHHFKPATVESCKTCHVETFAQWRQWKTSRRPELAQWPPGAVTWTKQADSRTCISCHMPAHFGASSIHDHSFLSPDLRSLLISGLHARIEPPSTSHGPQLVLTNLSGHAYPAGTLRRALRIDLTYDNAPGSPQLLTFIADPRMPTTQPTEPALAPGEQRRISIPARSRASQVTCRITYEQNRFVSHALQVPLYQLTEPIGWPSRNSRQVPDSSHQRPDDH